MDQGYGSPVIGISVWGAQINRWTNWNMEIVTGIYNILQQFLRDSCVIYSPTSGHVGKHLPKQERPERRHGIVSPQHKWQNSYPLSKVTILALFLRKANGQMDSRKSDPWMHAYDLEKGKASDSTTCHTD